MITPFSDPTYGVIAEEKTVADFLWNQTESNICNLYAIVDSALNEEIFRYFLISNIRYRSLYQGTVDQQSWGVSGFLVECKKESELFKWMTTKAWGNSCSVFFTSRSSFDDLFKHFQKFNRVYLEDDEVVLFRYYDPRVLRIYLPTCNRYEIETFFGEINSFLVESYNPGEIMIFRKDEIRGSSMKINI
jgi:hypothetical protein